MIIKIANLSNGVHCFDFDKSVEDLGLEDSFSGLIKASVKLDKSTHQIVLDIESKANYTFVCDRCGADSNTDLLAKFQLVYIFSSQKIESEDSNVKYITPDVDKINISDDLKEYLILSVPMKNLCSPDCKGLCPECGTNLNKKKCKCKKEIIYDVWEPLKKLKNKSN
jgi:uncharacterized protein